MGIISNFEGQSQIRNLLNNENYDKEKADQFLKNNAKSTRCFSCKILELDKYVKEKQERKKYKCIFIQNKKIILPIMAMELYMILSL